MNETEYLAKWISQMVKEAKAKPLNNVSDDKQHLTNLMFMVKLANSPDRWRWQQALDRLTWMVGDGSIWL